MDTAEQVTGLVHPPRLTRPHIIERRPAGPVDAGHPEQIDHAAPGQRAPSRLRRDSTQPARPARRRRGCLVHPPAVPVATVPAPAPVFVTPPPVVYAPPVAYGPAYYPAPYPYVGAYNPIVPFGIGVGLGVLAGGWGGYGWRGGYWHGGGWRR